MKKITFLSLLLSLFAITSCSDSDNEPAKPTADISGTYSGYTEASCAYFQGNMADNQEIKIAKNSDDTYKVSYTSDTWGEFTITNATATLSGSKFVIAGSGKTLMGMNGDIKEYDCTIAGTIGADKENPTFTFTVPSVMGGLTITFHTGSMPATE